MSEEERKKYENKVLATTIINGKEKNLFPAACAVAALNMSIDEITSPGKKSKLFAGDYFCLFFILVNLASKCIG